MTPTRETLVRLLHEIAPETDPAAIDPKARLREELDLDSMAWLAFMQAIARDVGVEIPEREYRNLRSLDDCVDFVERSSCKPSPMKERRLP
jgi:acyl carrier protein